MIWTEEKMQELFNQFQQRVAGDGQFRSLSLADPARAYKELTGNELPEGVQLKVLENEQGQLGVQLLYTGERELDDSELMAVTGGSDFACFPAAEGENWKKVPC